MDDEMTFDGEQEPKGPRPERDKSAGEGMGLHELEALLSDIDQQPVWRPQSDRAAQYYDGKQLSAARLQELEDNKEPATVVNLISGAINGVLGQEEKSRLDWAVASDSDAAAEMVEVANLKLTQAKREAGADAAISEGYKGQIIPGIGWVEVGRNSDPLEFPYKVKAKNRNQVWWDWRANDAMLDEGRWQCVQAWVDLDVAKHAMPQYADHLEITCGSAAAFTDAMSRQIMHSHSQFEAVAQNRASFSRFEEEWLDNSLRRRVRFYDVYYKKPRTVVALVGGDKRVEYQPNNPLHQAMVHRGLGYLVRGPSYQMRHARFAGPLRLFDKPRRSRRFPLVPFIGFTDDEFGTPYGMVDCMMSPQDEYNERRSRLRWLLKAAQVFVDDDALNEKFNNFRDLAREVMRPDSVFIMNKARRNKDGLRIEHNLQLAAEQVDVMNDAKGLIQEVPRIYSSMLGDAPTGVTSGTAINSLVEQGMVAMGETNGNYRTGRGRVGELLLELVVEDHRRPNMRIKLGKGKTAREVVLNTFDDKGLPVNHMEDAPLTTGLSDIPSSPAFKAQRQANLTNLLGVVGPDPLARAVLLPDLVETMEVPHAEEKARWLRGQYGLPEGGVSDPRAEAAAAEQMAKTKAAQEAGAAAEIDDKQAGAAQKQAQASLATAKAAQIIQQMQEPRQQPNIDDAVVDDAIARA